MRRETIDHPNAVGGHPGRVRGVPHADGARRSRARLAARARCSRTCRSPTARSRAAAAGGRRRLVHRLPSDRARQLGTRESFNGDFVDPADAAPTARALIFGPYQIDRGPADDHALGDRLRAGRGAAHQAVGAVRDVPHADHAGVRPERRGHRIAARADELSGVAAQRLQHGRAQLPVVPHAGSAGADRASSVLGDARDRLSRHLFVGGNAFMVRMLNRYRDELGVEALRRSSRRRREATDPSAAAGDRDARRSRAPSSTAGTLAFDVDVRNLTGHKFPTGYPSRRPWLHVTVRDAQGRTRLRIRRGRRHRRDSRATTTTPIRCEYEPHYDQITQRRSGADLRADPRRPAGVPTTGLLTATQYLKDNRLLPRGFDKATADRRDRRLRRRRQRRRLQQRRRSRPLRGRPCPAAGPFTVEVELRYQPIGYRWAHNLETLRRARTEAVRRLLQARCRRRPRRRGHGDRTTGRQRP